MYYVKPSTDYPCSQQPCDTLSGYIGENSVVTQRNGSSNITMIFLPGTHTVSRNWIITNVSYLTLHGSTGTQSNFPAQIECITQAYFKFTDIHTLNIDSLSVSHCGVPANDTAGTTALVISAQNIQTLLITSSCFLENLYGSAILASETEKVIVGDSLFDRNSASDSGGAIVILDVVKLEIKNSNFTNNNCREVGGAIHLNTIEKISITNSNFVNNSVCRENCKPPMTFADGGGISIFGCMGDSFITTVIFDGLILFENNFARGNGGGLYASDATLSFLGETIFHNNTAHLQSGGALAVVSGCNVTIKNSNFTKNSCRRNGGAIYLDNIYMLTSITNSSFVNNLAYHGEDNCNDCSTGGGISIFIYDRGHGYSMAATSVIFDGLILFENNFVLGRGGGLYAADVTSVSFLGETIFHNNIAHLNAGGALVLIGGYNVTISVTSFRKNQAVKAGGAALISDVAFLSLTNCTFVDNYVAAGNNSLIGGGGGGLAVFGLTEARNYSTITNNGCINDDESVDLLFENITILNNFVNSSAVNGRGLLNVDAYNVISINSTKVVFKGVTLFRSNYCGLGDGGGLYVQDVVLEFQGKTYFQNNYATNTGGGMAMYSIKALFRDDTFIEHNIANLYGGGVSSRDSTVSFRGETTKFFKNYARSLSGGGLDILRSSIAFTGTEIIFNSNQASEGGGIAGVSFTLKMNAERITFTNNTANFGGAISTAIDFQSNNIISKTEIEFNCTGVILFANNCARQTGGGLALLNTRLFLRGEITVKNNDAVYRGGWLFAHEGIVSIQGKFKAEYNRAAEGGVISGERLTASLEASYAEFKDNVALAGGSITISQHSQLHLMCNSSFTRNYAKDGGALYLRSFSRLNLYSNTRVLFSSNHAVKGGAIYVDDYTYVDNSDRDSLRIGDCFFESKIIQVDKTSLRIKQFLFYNNTADKGQNLFGGHLDRCKLKQMVTFVKKFSVSDISIHYGGREAWFLLSNSSNNKSISSHPVRVCFCIHNSPNCTYELPTLSKYRGELINFSVVVVDQVETPLLSVIRAQFTKHSNGQLGEGEYLQTLPVTCSQLTFHVFSPDGGETLEIYSDDGP